MEATENILIIDDHPVVLDGLILSLKDINNSYHIKTALNADEAVVSVKNNSDFDWIFIDVNLPGINGIELLGVFESMKVTANVVVLSSDSDPSIIDKALKGHASGFLSKSFDTRELSECIQRINKGNVYLSQAHKRDIKQYRDSILKDKELIEDKLSERQYQTLQLLANGYSNQEIASSLDIVESTVKSHVHALMILFRADNRTHCVAEARRLHIIA